MRRDPNAYAPRAEDYPTSRLPSEGQDAERFGNHEFVPSLAFGPAMAGDGAHIVTESTRLTPGYPPCPMFQDRPNWLTGCKWPFAQNPHLGGMNVVLGDGSVRNVARGISPEIWAAACDPRDGVALGEW